MGTLNPTHWLTHSLGLLYCSLSLCNKRWWRWWWCWYRWGQAWRRVSSVDRALSAADARRTRLPACDSCSVDRGSSPSQRSCSTSVIRHVHPSHTHSVVIATWHSLRHHPSRVITARAEPGAACLLRTLEHIIDRFHAPVLPTFITSVKEVMFSPVSVCLFVCQ